MDAIMEALKDLIFSALALLITLLANNIREWMKENRDNKTLQNITSRLAANKEIVAVAVHFAEQAYRDLDGPEKLERAKDRAIAMLQEKGLPVNENEVDMLIEAIILQMNEEKKKSNK